jgi:hypothetical protein
MKKKPLRRLFEAAFEPANRKSARQAWAIRTTAAWREAQRQMDDRCTEAVDRLSEEAFERLFEAEEAKVDAIRAQIDSVIDRDLWPKELYWGGI